MKRLQNKRILITGASGMLGVALLGQFPNAFGTGNSEFKENPFKQYKRFDLKSNSYDEIIEWSYPDVIIHCAAIINGNYCQNHPLDAFEVNAISLKKLINSTSDKVKIIYISTDAVFPSDLKLAKEEDPVFPENIYGKSKELGEFFLLNSNRDFNIIRTTIVGLNSNPNKKSFAEWVIKSSQSDNINLFSDVRFTPISVWDLGEEINFIIQNEVSDKILHIAGSEICTKYNFGVELLESLGFSTNNVKAGSIFDFKDRAKRATNQSLNCEYYQKKYLRYLPTLKQTIKSIKNHYSS